MTRLNIQLSGGLGNQLFQYAVARAISIKYKIPLAVDEWSGFVRDAQYRRQFELGRLSIDVRRPSARALAALWIRRSWISIFDKKAPSIFSRTWFGDFYYETEFNYHPALLNTPIHRLTWLIGYWQSPLYFNNYKKTLHSELMPPTPTNNIFLNMGFEMKNSESVALGLRLYEESDNPANHAKAGQLKSAYDLNKTIALLITQRPNSRFFIFCTHRTPLIKELQLPKNSVLVTGEDGYSDSLDCLWLLTQCKHHIFTNSSFYWWGAWLSEAVHPNTEQLIYAADNFIKADGLCDHWHRF